MKSTYRVEIECSNCGCKGNIDIPKGTPANCSMECPNCGCMTAHKKNYIKDEITYPKIRPFKIVEDERYNMKYPTIRMHSKELCSV